MMMMMMMIISIIIRYHSYYHYHCCFYGSLQDVDIRHLSQSTKFSEMFLRERHLPSFESQTSSDGFH